MSLCSRLYPALVAGTLALATPAYAGPTVLRDDLVTDLATTPALGRGYSLATNTYQSMCLTEITRTKPSYNFYYRFEDLEADGKTSSTTKVSGSGSYNGGGFGIKVKVNASGSGTVIDNTTYYDHYITVKLDIDVYYSSIDESKSRIGEAARELLTSNDIPGFFDACGMYYARSIGRSAHFLSLFDYKTTSQSRDKSFEAKLEAEVKGWGQSASVTVQSSGDFRSEASSKRLTIESTALGLGKNESASLIAYDLETFRKAVKDAFVSMQNDDTGLITTVEVVPWVENSDFQRIIKLQDAKSGDNGVTVSPYAQKRILNQNGEFMAELDRASRAKLNVYYKAKQCRRRIDLDYKKDGQLLPAYATSKVLNHRTEAQVLLSELDQQLTDTAINNLYNEHSTFLYGSAGIGGASSTGGTSGTGGTGGMGTTGGTSGTSGTGGTGGMGTTGGTSGTGTTGTTGTTGGVVQCVRDLTAAGLTVKPYREIAACAAVEPQLGVITGQLLDEVCMPTIVE